MPDPIGHGALGLRSNQPTFRSLMEASASAKIALVEARPAAPVSAWALDTGETYVAPFGLQIDGIARDVVGVRTALDQGLTRAESLTVCRATRGTYYYDPDVTTGSARWDDGRSKWDGTAQWDQFGQLYVHLADGSNPAAVTVMAALGFYFATVGVYHPALGAEMVVDGGFAQWASATQPSQWIVTLGPYTWDNGVTVWDGAVSWDGTAKILVAQDAVTPYSGRYAITFYTDGSIASPEGGARTSVQVVAGARYRLSVVYQTDASNASTFFAALRVGLFSPPLFLQLDGRSTSSSATDLVLANTGGEWRSACFDYLAPATGTLDIMARAYGTGTPGASAVRFDSISHRRIWRTNYYEPRVKVDGVPSAEVGMEDIYFGGQSVGLGSLSLNNADGGLDEILAQLDWLNSEVRTFVGGATQDGVELLMQEYRQRFTGLVQSAVGDDRSVSLDLQDIRVRLQRTIPPRVYSVERYPQMDPAFASKPRPVWFGPRSNVTPVGLTKDATTGYRTYEVADTEKAPAGLYSISAVYAYADDTAAGNKDTTRRVTLAQGTDYTVDLAAGSVSIIADCGPYEVTAEAREVSFNVGASELTAQLALGLYTAAQLAAEVASKMTTAAGTAIACAYSDSTHKFTISKASGTLQLLCKTRTSKVPAWALLGYREDADKTAALSYASDDATFTDPDTDHVLRVDGTGYADDSAGTYTGLPNRPVQIGPDVCAFLWRLYGGQPASSVDLESFVAARTTAPQVLGIYLREAISLRDVFSRLEMGSVATINLDGAGTIYFEPYTSTVPGSAPQLLARDLLSFSSEISYRDVYATLNLYFDEDPSTGARQVRTVSSSQAEPRWSRPESRDFDTYLTAMADAIAASNIFLALAVPTIVYKATAKGKLLDCRPGSKVVVTRARAVSLSGSLSAQALRVLRVFHEPASGRSSIDAVPVS